MLDIVPLLGVQATLSTTSLGVGQHVITATYNPSTPNFVLSYSATNAAPNATITGPPTGSVQAVNTAFNFTATFTDATGYTPNATAAWSFDTAISVAGAVTESSGSGTVTKSFSFSSAGVYAVTLTLNDNQGGITITNTIAPDNLPSMIVVYDPNGGFVTGGGWINSPAGAYLANPNLNGKANFGFVSKYQKGSNVPVGQTEFQFQVANFNFHSEIYQWLVVAGPKAQYKGTGTINGAGNYGFLLTATDGQINGGGGVDKFRIKIWDIDNGGAIVYDNVLGASDDIDTANPIAISGGSIVIHK